MKRNLQATEKLSGRRGSFMFGVDCIKMLFFTIHLKEAETTKYLRRMWDIQGSENSSFDPKICIGTTSARLVDLTTEIKLWFIPTVKRNRYVNRINS